MDSIPTYVSFEDREMIEQAYVTKHNGSLLRLRVVTGSSRGNYGVVTVKGKSDVEGGISEFEMELPYRIACDLMYKQNQVLSKIRLKHQYDTFCVELDVFLGKLEGLLVAEVEFDSPEASKAFVPPAWFGREVTDDRRYANAALIETMSIPE